MDAFYDAFVPVDRFIALLTHRKESRRFVKSLIYCLVLTWEVLSLFCSGRRWVYKPAACSITISYGWTQKSTSPLFESWLQEAPSFSHCLGTCQTECCLQTYNSSSSTTGVRHRNIQSTPQSSIYSSEPFRHSLSPERRLTSEQLTDGINQKLHTSSRTRITLFPLLFEGKSLANDYFVSHCLAHRLEHRVFWWILNWANHWLLIVKSPLFPLQGQALKLLVYLLV